MRDYVLVCMRVLWGLNDMKLHSLGITSLTSQCPRAIKTLLPSILQEAVWLSETNQHMHEEDTVLYLDPFALGNHFILGWARYETREDKPTPDVGFTGVH